jgi:hypothetical protein
LQLFHNLLVEPPLGKWFKFSGITRGWLKIASLPDKIGVYLTNSGSKVEPIPEVKQVQHCAVLMIQSEKSYRGWKYYFQLVPLKIYCLLFSIKMLIKYDIN